MLGILKDGGAELKRQGEGGSWKAAHCMVVHLCVQVHAVHIYCITGDWYSYQSPKRDKKRFVLLRLYTDLTPRAALGRLIRCTSCTSNDRNSANRESHPSPGPDATSNGVRWQSCRLAVRSVAGRVWRCVPCVPRACWSAALASVSLHASLRPHQVDCGRL